MTYENKHQIESLAKAACPNNKKVSIIFQSKENKLSDRPNAFLPFYHIFILQTKGQ